MSDRKRIGFVTYWGWGRGQASLSLCYTKMLQNEHDLFILKQFNNPISDDFKGIKAKINEYDKYEIPESFFEEWVTTNKLDIVIFNEYLQWNDARNNLSKICKKHNVKTLGFLVIEKFKKEQSYDYDMLLASTVTFERFMRMHKVRNFKYVPMSIDFNEFPKIVKEYSLPFVFFHPGGWGGVHDRKNTNSVIEAFKLLNNPDTKLIISSQKPLNMLHLAPNIEIIDKNLTRKDLLDLYNKSHATILPSKWETIGIPILESLASGVPVITSNVPPMNEFIVECTNGYLCMGEGKNYPDISVTSMEVNALEIKKKMELMLNEFTYKIVQRNARHVAEQLYDLEKNKHYFLELIEEITK